MYTQLSAAHTSSRCNMPCFAHLYSALWSGTNKNQDVSTGSLARPFARSIVRSLARSLRSLPHSWESEFLMSQNDLVLSHSAVCTWFVVGTSDRAILKSKRRELSHSSILSFAGTAYISLHLLAPHCLLLWHALLRSSVGSLAHLLTSS